MFIQRWYYLMKEESVLYSRTEMIFNEIVETLKIGLKSRHFSHIFLFRFVENFASLMDGVIFLTFSIGTLWLSTSLAQYLVHIFRPVTINKIIFNWIFLVNFFKGLWYQAVSTNGCEYFNHCLAVYLLFLWTFNFLEMSANRRFYLPFAVL